MTSTPTTAGWPAENYEAPRLTIAAGDYDDLPARFESTVPTAPMAAVNALIERGADWDEMLELIDNAAPYGFLIYTRIDIGPVMASAGDGGRGVEYLMGNHTIAERMYRHDQRDAVRTLAALPLRDAGRHGVLRPGPAEPPAREFRR